MHGFSLENVVGRRRTVLLLLKASDLQGNVLHANSQPIIYEAKCSVTPSGKDTTGPY